MKSFGKSIDLILIGSAIVAGWWFYGWQGLIMAFTVIAFWSVLQFSRAARLLRKAAAHPIGSLQGSVVMLQSQLSPGMSLAEVIALTGSLGVRVGKRDDWTWTDAGGDEIMISLRREVVVRWAVARGDQEEKAVSADDAPVASSDSPAAT